MAWNYRPNAERTAAEMQQLFGMGRPMGPGAPPPPPPSFNEQGEPNVANLQRTLNAVVASQAHGPGMVQIGAVRRPLPQPAAQPQPPQPPPTTVDTPLPPEVYEAMLPPAVQASRERRRQNGFDVPDRPVPDHVLRAWRAAGPNLTQAQIQWGYAQRDAEERRQGGAAGRQAGGPPAGVSAGGPPPTGRSGRGRPANVPPPQDDEYVSDLQALTEYYRNGGRIPQPGSPEFDQEGDILAYRDGMTDEEYRAAKANEQYRRNMIRGMGGDGGLDAQVHPQQPLNLGTAQQQKEWNDWVHSSLARMRRYDPDSVPEVKIDNPNWRTVLQKQLDDGRITEDEYKAQAEKYRSIEDRQRARELVKRYGANMSDDTLAKLTAAHRSGLGLTDGSMAQMGQDAYLNDLAYRVRNLADLRQNQRIVGLLNDPNARQGFIYRTMAEGTPEERSALAAAVGNPMVYSEEMQNAFPDPAVPAAATEEPFDPANTTPTGMAAHEAEKIRNVLRGNGDAPVESALTLAQAYAASANQDLAPDDPSRVDPAEMVTIEALSAAAVGGRAGVDYLAHPAVQQVLGRYADQGFDAFVSFTSRAGYSYEQAAQLFERIRPGRRPDGAAPPPSRQPPTAASMAPRGGRQAPPAQPPAWTGPRSPQTGPNSPGRRSGQRR